MSQPTENEKLELSLQKFEKIMQYRSDMYMRLAKRVRVFVRGGMFIVALVACGLSVLMYTLATELQRAAGITQELQANVTQVGSNMGEMRLLIANMEKRMQVMENMQKDLNGITGYTDVMVQDMKHINYNMGKMGYRLHNIDGSLKNMTQSVSNIGDSVKQVGRDVDDMAKPATPFDYMPSP